MTSTTVAVAGRRATFPTASSSSRRVKASSTSAALAPVRLISTSRVSSIGPRIAVISARDALLR